MAAARPRSGARPMPSRGGGGTTLSDLVFTVDDLVVYLKLPKSTVYKLAQEGKIPGQKVGRHWRFHKNAIDRWLGDEEVTP